MSVISQAKERILSASSVALSCDVDEAVGLLHGIVDSDATEPTPEQIRDGLNAQGVPAEGAGSVAITAIGTSDEIVIENLPVGWAHNYWLVHEPKYVFYTDFNEFAVGDDVQVVDPANYGPMVALATTVITNGPIREAPPGNKGLGCPAAYQSGGFTHTRRLAENQFMQMTLADTIYPVANHRNFMRIKEADNSDPPRLEVTSPLLQFASTLALLAQARIWGSTTGVSLGGR